MATSTTVAAFRSALVTAVTAAAPEVQVTYGEKDTPRKEHILLGATTTGTDEAYALQSGRRKREENFDTEVFVRVSSKANAKANEARAAELVAVVEGVLADNVHLSVDGVLFALISDFEWDTGYGPDSQPKTEVTLTVTTKARLT